ncbi:MAG TPA: ABC transporter substrate-binding protein [Solirubrobacterales bacterium]
MLAVAMAAALLAGCGGGSGSETTKSAVLLVPQELHIALDGYPGPQNVGVLMAEEQGYFDDVGIEISISSPLGPLRPVRYVVGGEVDLSISHLPQVALAAEKEAPVVAIGSLIPQSTAAMIWLKKSKISSIADLKGKTIAIPGLSFQKDLLENLLAQAGLTLPDVKVETVEYDLVPALVSGRADAIFGGSWNVEGADLEARNLDPVITRVQDLGIPPYEEMVLIARPDRLSDDPRPFRAFTSALARGTAYAIAHPRAAVTAVVDAYKRYDADVRVNKTWEAEVKATLSLLSKDAYMDPDQADELVEWMHEQGMIQGKPPASSLLTNDYVEPQ